jgi:hypothetical protein
MTTPTPTTPTPTTTTRTTGALNWNEEDLFDPWNILDPNYRPVGPDPAGPSHGHITPQPRTTKEQA